jgi:hydroxyacylglutathione hydrolase
MLQVIICKVEKWFLFKNFTYIIFNTENKEGIIIDPTWDLNFIEKKIEESNIKLKGILITHTHFDHVNLVDAFVEKYDCNVYVGEPELSYSNFHAKNLKPIASENIFLIGSIKVSPVFTPGHSPGSICYLIGDNLFTGDTLFIEGCGMCFGNRAHANPSVLFRSLQKLKQIIPDDTRIYPGHSYGELPGQYMSELMKINIYLNFEKEEYFIKYRTRRGQRGLFNFK